MRVTIASTAFLMLLGIDQAFAQWEGYGCCGAPTPGPADAPANWCENLPLLHKGHRGYMLCCQEADLDFGPLFCDQSGFLNEQTITTYASKEGCESGGQPGFRACARRFERYERQ
ncbi:hypothetical protein PTMSG1_02917 [Pyrenophora teres f. maculata]|nr:hypothetical protein PTMSG1_02917 [Pyrenophora teres f. maculata]